MTNSSLVSISRSENQIYNIEIKYDNKFRVLPLQEIYTGLISFEFIRPVLWHWLCVEVYVITINFTVCTRTYPGHTQAAWVAFKQKLYSNSSYVEQV